MTNEKPISYYNSRLEEVIRIFRNHDSALIDKNIDKVKILVNEYNQFKNDSEYNPSLVGAIETFILK